MTNKIDIEDFNKDCSVEEFSRKMNSWLIKNSLLGTNFCPSENIEMLGLSNSGTYNENKILKVGATQWTNSFIRSPHLAAFNLLLAKERGKSQLKSNPVFVVAMSHLIQIGALPYDFFAALPPDVAIEYLDELNNFQSLPKISDGGLNNKQPVAVFHMPAFNTSLLYQFIVDGIENLALSGRHRDLSFANWNTWLSDNFFEMEIIVKRFIVNGGDDLKMVHEILFTL